MNYDWTICTFDAVWPGRYAAGLNLPRSTDLVDIFFVMHVLIGTYFFLASACRLRRSYLFDIPLYLFAGS